MAMPAAPPRTAGIRLAAASHPAAPAAPAHCSGTAQQMRGSQQRCLGNGHALPTVQRTQTHSVLQQCAAISGPALPSRTCNELRSIRGQPATAAHQFQLAVSWRRTCHSVWHLPHGARPTPCRRAHSVAPTDGSCGGDQHQSLARRPHWAAADSSHRQHMHGRRRIWSQNVPCHCGPPGRHQLILQTGISRGANSGPPKISYCAP